MLTSLAQQLQTSHRSLDAAANDRNGEWDRRLGLGNPAADKCVKDYLRLVTAEQLQARVTPKQATPFFVDKLTRLAEHLQRSLGNAKSNIERFIVARDQAYFKTAFFSGDRPGDLGQVKTSEILRFPNDDGFYLIIFEEKHLETVIRMCLEFEEIRKQRFAPSEG